MKRRANTAGVRGLFILGLGSNYLVRCKFFDESIVANNSCLWFCVVKLSGSNENTLLD